jgi:CheY-like chemotaxis protein
LPRRIVRSEFVSDIASAIGLQERTKKRAHTGRRSGLDASYPQRAFLVGNVIPRERGVILVVDDDADYRTMVRCILEHERYFVLEAGDGSDALDVLRSEAASAIRLIVLDLAMPTMTGWQLVEVLRDDPALSRLPVLVTSAIPVHGDASGIGATMPSLGKPIDANRLLSAVATAMTRRPNVTPVMLSANDAGAARRRNTKLS